MLCRAAASPQSQKAEHGSYGEHIQTRGVRLAQPVGCWNSSCAYAARLPVEPSPRSAAPSPEKVMALPPGCLQNPGETQLPWKRSQSLVSQLRSVHALSNWPPGSRRLGAGCGRSVVHQPPPQSQDQALAPTSSPQPGPPHLQVAQPQRRQVRLGSHLQEEHLQPPSTARMREGDQRGRARSGGLCLPGRMRLGPATAASSPFLHHQEVMELMQVMDHQQPQEHRALGRSWS